MFSIDRALSISRLDVCGEIRVVVLDKESEAYLIPRILLIDPRSVNEIA